MESEPSSLEDTMLIRSLSVDHPRTRTSFQAVMILCLILASSAGVGYLLYIVQWKPISNFDNSFDKTQSRHGKSLLNMRVTFTQETDADVPENFVTDGYVNEIKDFNLDGVEGFRSPESNETETEADAVVVVLPSQIIPDQEMTIVKPFENESPQLALFQLQDSYDKSLFKEYQLLTEEKLKNYGFYSRPVEHLLQYVENIFSRSKLGKKICKNFNLFTIRMICTTQLFYLQSINI